MKRFFFLLLLAVSLSHSAFAGRWPTLKSRVYRLTFADGNGEPSDAVRDIYEVTLLDMFEQNEQSLRKNPLYQKIPGQPQWIQNLHWRIVRVGSNGWMDLEFTATKISLINLIVWKIRTGQYAFKQLISIDLIQANNEPCSKHLELKY